MVLPLGFFSGGESRKVEMSKKIKLKKLILSTIITKMKRKLEYVKHKNNIPFKKHKLLDFRNIERFAKFDMFK